MADGARTHDNRNHNPGLYQLSYSHHRADDCSKRPSTGRLRNRSGAQDGALAAASRETKADSLTVALNRPFSAA